MKIALLKDNIDSLIEEGRQVLSTEFADGARVVGYPLGRPRGFDLEAFANDAAHNKPTLTESDVK